MYYKTLLISSLFLIIGCKQISKTIDTYAHPKPQPYSKDNPNDLTKVRQSIINNNQIPLLQKAEFGLINLYQQNYQASARSMNQAKLLYEKTYENSKYYDATPNSIAKVFSNVYMGEKYDKVFIHNYTAIAYLLMGKVEDAKAESRMAERFQNRAKVSFEEYKRKYDNSKNAKLISKYEEKFSQIDPQHHPYANPFADYIFALACAENGNYCDPNDYIKKAMRYLPDSQILESKLKQYSQREKVSTVELFFDVGQSPLKSEFKDEMKMGNGDVRTVYLPSFDFFKNNTSYIKIIDSHGREITRTSLLVDVDAIKINEFREKLPSLLSLISTQFVKDLAYYASERQSSSWLEVLLKGIIALHGRPSQATWVTLPKKTLVASFVPKKNESYSMIVVSNAGNTTDRRKLQFTKNSQTKNIYRYFSIKENNFSQ